MRKNRKRGFTLVEIIVSLAIIGIIAAGIIPIFGLQYKMTLDTKNITANVFDAQGEVENKIFLLKEALISPSMVDEYAIDGVTSTSAIIFGTAIPLYKLKDVFPSNANKSFTVFLSKILAINEVRPLLDALDVRIDVISDNPYSADNKTAYLVDSPKPTLLGLVDAFDPASSWKVNLYKWYVSKEGNTNPVFPDDYEKIVLTGDPANHNQLNDLTKFANRYVEFTVTPVDVNGVRGKETRSNIPVYVVGKDWRTGVFAWVDKDEDSLYTNSDVKVEKWDVGDYWALLEGFDSNKTFPDKIDPRILLDPKLGSLYVPMGINRSLDTVGPILVQGTKSIVWTVDKSIHLATDILVGNDSDVELEVKDGNLVLYQYLAIGATGDAIIVNGMPVTIDDGARVATSQGSILLQTSGRGSILLQDFTELDSGMDISLIPFGNINMNNNIIKAKGQILLDTTKGLTFPGNRDILIQGARIEGNPTRSLLEISSSDEVMLSGTAIKNCDVRIKSDATMRGGSWDANSIIRVANGKTLTLGGQNGQIDNPENGLDLGNTGQVSFMNTMENDLHTPIHINLSKIGFNQVLIGTDYGRNVGYANSGSNIFQPINYKSYQNLGSGTPNLEYTIEKNSGDVDSVISCSFDQESKSVTIAAGGIGPISSYYTLYVKDLYAEDVKGSIAFHVTAGEGETPVVEVIGPDTPKRIVTFFKTFGDATSISSINVEIGKEIGTLMPPDPTKIGWGFNGWKTLLGDVISSASKIWENITAYGQWTDQRLGFTMDPITGNLRVGSVLTAGGLHPVGATVTYQWQKSDLSGGTYVDVVGATSSTYTLGTDDAGKYFRVVATGTETYVGTATSSPTSIIQGAYALSIVANTTSHYVTITSNYGDVVTNNTAANINAVNTWVNLSNNLQVQVSASTPFPTNMTRLTLTPNPSNDRVTITGRESNNTNISNPTTLRVIVRDKTTTTITKEFTVVVSGTSGSNAITIGIITVL